MGAGPTPYNRGNSAQTAEQAAQAYELRLSGASFRTIASVLGVSVSTAHDRVTSAIAERVDPLADQYRAVELDRLDALTARAWRIMTSDHIVVQHGKIVRDEDGNPVKDDGPVIAAIGVLVRISERRSKLLGLDAAVKVDAQVTPVDPKDIELAQMIEQVKQRNAAEEARLRGEDPPAIEGQGGTR
ncbi:hypothetical protein ACFYOK_10780 [Microbispora bryophytorum]|uniref:hypothetical protein n=1 Tax=Microbispora bryophytorum TaxID=1460882 RepID=UPI0033FEC614